MPTKGTEGEASGGALPRYYVVLGGREKGPYTVAQLLASYRDGALGQATQVRAEDEEETRPLTEVLALGRLASPERAPRPLRAPSVNRARSKSEPDAPRPRRFEGVELEDVYAPPAADEPLSEAPSSRVPQDPGSFGLGFALGFFGGCISLLVSAFLWRRTKPETRRGLVIGFAVQFGIGILLQIMKAANGGP